MTTRTELQDVEKIIVLDYGSQYNQLISRRIREIGVFSELKSHKITADEVRAIQPVGIILSGGPNSVYEDGSFDIDPEIFELGIPILGICYGMQLLTHKLGGKVVPAGHAGNREYGQSTLSHTANSSLFNGTPESQLVLMSHGDAVTEIPSDFVCTGTSADCPFAAIENPQRYRLVDCRLLSAREHRRQKSLHHQKVPTAPSCHQRFGGFFEFPCQ